MAICPYFGQDKKFCDIGEEYISPYDVVAMSHFCSSRYRECDKFQALAESHPEVLEHEVATPVAKEEISSPSTQPHVQPKQIKIKFRNKWPLSQRLSSAIALSQATSSPSYESLTGAKPQPESKKINHVAQVVLAGVGILLYGFCLASVSTVPLAKHLSTSDGLQQLMVLFGITLAVVFAGLGMLLSSLPKGVITIPHAHKNIAKSVSNVPNLKPFELLKSVRFYTLWLCFFVGSGAAMMVIGHAMELIGGSLQDMAFLVVILSVGSAAGCLFGGVVANKVGRATTLGILLALQASLMFGAIPILQSGNGSSILAVTLVAAIVFNFGANLSLFPALAKDSWGMKHFGINYSLLFSAWGAGAFTLIRVSDLLKVKNGSMESSFIVAGVLLLVGTMMAWSLRKQKISAAESEPTGLMIEEDELLLQDVRD